MRPEIKEVRKLAKKYGVKVYFRPLKGAVAGICDVEEEIITINSYLSSRQEIISCLFHELSHIFCFKASASIFSSNFMRAEQSSESGDGSFI